MKLKFYYFLKIVKYYLNYNWFNINKYDDEVWLWFNLIRIGIINIVMFNF